MSRLKLIQQVVGMVWEVLACALLQGFFLIPVSVGKMVNREKHFSGIGGGGVVPLGGLPRGYETFSRMLKVPGGLVGRAQIVERVGVAWIGGCVKLVRLQGFGQIALRESVLRLDVHTFPFGYALA